MSSTDNVAAAIFPDYYEPWWIAPSEFTPDQACLHRPAKVELLSRIISDQIGRQVKAIEYIANGVFHTVYNISFESGPAIVSRIAFNFKDTERGRAAVRLKMERETGVLRLVKAIAPNVPVPTIVYSDPDPHNVLSAPFMLMEKLPGRSSGYGDLKGGDIESFVRSLAKVYVSVFEITLPRIGAYLETSASGEPIVGPVIDEREENPGGPFDTINEYLEWLFSSTLNHPRNKSSAPDVDLLDLFPRLSNLAQLLLPRNPITRNALVHLDPHERNLLVEGTEVTGLIDWEVGPILAPKTIAPGVDLYSFPTATYVKAQASLPSYLAARYPTFLRRDGIFNERYVSTLEAERSGSSRDGCSSGGSANMMNVGPRFSSQEAEHLREVFVKAAEKINPEFVEALQQGEKLRQLLDWLTFAEWDGPWVWKGCELWERDVRASITN